jgi:hypothetical protein
VIWFHDFFFVGKLKDFFVLFCFFCFVVLFCGWFWLVLFHPTFPSFSLNNRVFFNIYLKSCVIVRSFYLLIIFVGCCLFACLLVQFPSVFSLLLVHVLCCVVLCCAVL